MDGAQEPAEVEVEAQSAEPDLGRKVEDMRSMVSSLQNAVIEIRSAVSEIENPFNVLRLITSEKDLDALQGARVLKEGKGSPEPDRPEEPLTHEPELEEASQESVVEEESTRTPLPSRSMSVLIILKWIWDLLDLGLDEKDIADLCSYCEYVGYLPRGSSDHVSALAPMAVKARKRGASREEFILNIYSAAAASGIGLRSDDMNEVVLGAMKLVRENRRGGGG